MILQNMQSFIGGEKSIDFSMESQSCFALTFHQKTHNLICLVKQKAGDQFWKRYPVHRF